MSLNQEGLGEKRRKKTISGKGKSPKIDMRVLEVRSQLAEYQNHGGCWEFKRQVKEALNEIDRGEYKQAAKSIDMIAGGIEEEFFDHSWDYDGLEDTFENMAKKLESVGEKPPSKKETQKQELIHELNMARTEKEVKQIQRKAKKKNINLNKQVENRLESIRRSEWDMRYMDDEDLIEDKETQSRREWAMRYMDDDEDED